MKLDMLNNHPVIQFDGQYYIIDTGSPVSFRFDGIQKLELCGQSFSFSTPVCSKKILDRLTESDISGLIGLNVLSRTGFSVDFKNSTFEFSADDPIDPDETVATLSFDLFMGQYIITNDVSLDMPLKNAIIDTGAPIPYVSKKFLSGLTPTGDYYEDLSPSFGALKGEYYACNLFFKGLQTARNVKVGTMPLMLDCFGIFDAILGITSLTEKKIIFDFERKEIRVTI